MLFCGEYSGMDIVSALRTGLGATTCVSRRGTCLVTIIACWKHHFFSAYRERFGAWLDLVRPLFLDNTLILDFSPVLQLFPSKYNFFLQKLKMQTFFGCPRACHAGLREHVPVRA